MFDKNKFAKIIKDIKANYISQEEFAKKSGIGRTYLSQYMNMKLDKPPKPEILEKLANASCNITNYNELMNICGYLDEEIEKDLIQSLKTLELDKSDFEKALTAFLENFVYISNNPTIDIYEMEDSLIYYAYELLKKYYFKLINKELSILTDNSELDFEKQIYFEKAEENAWDKMKIIIENIDENKIISNLTAEEKVDKLISKLNSRTQYYMCPVYGRISAGQPNWAEECLEGYLPIDPNLMNIISPEEYFFLKVNGESMNKIIRNGAYALIHKQDMVENGEIAVVLVNGDEATLKKFNMQNELVILEPVSNDDNYKLQIYDKNTPINILGKYVGKFEMNI